jgi:hypothetical protein
MDEGVTDPARLQGRIQALFLGAVEQVADAFSFWRREAVSGSPMGLAMQGLLARRCDAA